MDKVNIAEKLSFFKDFWNPKIVGELNGQQVKLVKLMGEFVWHSHEKEDELFYVLRGQLRMEFRDRSIIVDENEFIIVPKGIEHRPVAENEVSVMLFEPDTTLNTGNTKGELTRENPERI
jgi:mannose-6-phosphate isomerase-like protein (cupin superfamily)